MHVSPPPSKLPSSREKNKTYTLPFFRDIPLLVAAQYFFMSIFNLMLCTNYRDIFILIMKANKMHYSSDLFDKVHYIFPTCPLPIISNISTLYTQQHMLVLLAVC